MREIKNTLAIFKTRWREVALLVALFVISQNLTIYRPEGQKSFFYVNRALVFLFLGLSIVGFILNYGFLRTIIFDCLKRRSPVKLLNIGGHFFWRMLAFGILFAIVHLFLQWLISLVLSPLLYPDTTFLQRMSQYPLLHVIQASAVNLIMIKLILFIPALIIVKDCGFIDSFSMLKRCKLKRAIEPATLYFFSILLGVLLWAASSAIKEDSIFLYNCSIIFRSAVTQFLNLIVGATTVRYVATIRRYQYDISPEVPPLL